MDDLSGSDRILLARDPFDSLPSFHRQNSDVDFADVFGGPPRRSRGESLDSRSWRESGGSGSGFGEKPVFGETSGSPARRRHLKDDFFSDIFRSSESSCSSPLRRDFAPAPSPGSQMSSPTRNVVGGGSSLPAQISLSMKLAKDQPVFGSPTQRAIYKSHDGSPDTSSYPPSPIFSTTVLTTRVVTAQDDLKIDGHGLYRQSPLSRPNSQTMDRSPEVIDSPSVSIRSHSQKDPTSLEKYISNGQFHFSIYEWAGKGVTLIMPSKSSNKHGSMFECFPEIVVQEDELNLKKEDISASGSPSTIQSESQDTKLLKDLMKEDKDYAKSTLVDNLLPAEFETKFLPGDGTKILGNADLIRPVEGKEAMFRGQRSVYSDTNATAGKESKIKPVEVSSPSTSNPSVAQEGKMLGSKAKGKVKDFIKIFNQENLPKRKSTFETPGKRSRGKDEGASAAKLEEQVEAIFRNNDTSFSVPLEEPEKANFFMNSDVHMIDDLSERNDNTRPFSDLNPEILDDPVWNVEESHIEDLDGFSVEQIVEDQNKNMQIDTIQDQMKAIDAKIREWSKGKEGNIRSLLSTLQNVLWPESGWKQVPLVDLIEGAPVKRAYQKALLCLHPDKLQQKGASTHQKHTAEKVFDILQEAWIHFNSLSQL